MSVKNNHEFTEAGVTAFMTESNGRRYPNNRLAQNFDVENDEMREMLAKLVEQKRVEETVVGRQRVFFIRTEAEREAIMSMNAAPKAMKPYNPSGPEWDRVNERLAEFREIKSVQITKENV